MSGVDELDTVIASQIEHLRTDYPANQFCLALSRYTEGLVIYIYDFDRDAKRPIGLFNLDLHGLAVVAMQPGATLAFPLMSYDEMQKMRAINLGGQEVTPQ